jgi:hypothetical protein
MRQLLGKIIWFQKEVPLQFVGFLLDGGVELMPSFLSTAFVSDVSGTVIFFASESVP